MFCSECGNVIHSSDKFCSGCGNAASPTIAAAAPTANPEVAPPSHMPSFGKPNSQWWGVTTKELKPFPSPYEWLLSADTRSTLLVFDKYLALIPGAEKRSGIPSMLTTTIGGGLIGTLAMGAAGIALSAARGVKDKIANQSAGVDPERARDLFEAGNFVWCKKEDAEIWEIKQKTFFGLGGTSSCVLSCKFNSLLGLLPYIFPLRFTQDSFKDPVNSIGCKIIIKATGLTEDEANKVYKDFFKDF